MKLSETWLRDYIDLPKEMKTVLDRLTDVGLEVETVHARKFNTEFLEVAEILKSHKHPNADRLSLCDVKSKTRTYRVVCGATNYKAGDKVILALPGAKLPNGLEIKAAEIRGEKSEGMLCSETELKLAETSEGILILPQTTSLKDSVKSLLGVGETVFELNITPNRPDCMSFLGVARELSVILKKPLKIPMVKIKEGGLKKKKIKVLVKDSKKCPRYMARQILGVTIGPSPEWLKKKLESIGQRSINNVVDVTNFVLFELGQPLHAFDLDQIKDQTIIVRGAHPHETITTLDGTDRKLEAEDLVISDAQKPIALAGVMGGRVAEVSEQTTTILLESAYFNPPTIRRTSKRLGLQSESSRRFERGVDIDGVLFALNRAAQLLAQVSGGTVAKEVIDIYPKKKGAQKILLRKNRMESILGYQISPSECASILRRLGFRGGAGGRWSVPSHRVDIFDEVDLIEEVARFLGYNRIPTLEPRGTANLEQRIEGDSTGLKIVKQALVGLGFMEVINYSFYSPKLLEKIGYQGSFLKIQNPMGEDYSVMRPSLIPSMLNTIEFNIRQKNRCLRFFELRNIYDDKFKEELSLVVAMTGGRAPESWHQKPVEVDFFDIKGTLVSLLEKLHFEDISFEPVGDDPILQPGSAAWVLYKKRRVGRLGKVRPEIQERFDLGQVVWLFELTLSEASAQMRLRSTSIPRYPSIERDLSLLLPDAHQLSYDQLLSFLTQEGRPLLRTVSLFDRYQGEAIAAGHVSLSFRLTYAAPDRTLKDEEVLVLHERLCADLKRKWQIKIR